MTTSTTRSSTSSTGVSIPPHSGLSSGTSRSAITAAALVTDLRTIRAAAFMLDRREPPAAVVDARCRRRSRLNPRPARISRCRPRSAVAWRRRWPVWLAPPRRCCWPRSSACCRCDRARNADIPTTTAAARPRRREVTVESIAAEFEAAEPHYQKAIDDLQTIANADTGELDPQVAAVLQKNLTVIDQAISESRAALKSQPASTNAQDGLFDALRTKVALLQQTVELINEMRKGNQAEAGRKIQTLSQ